MGKGYICLENYLYLGIIKTISKLQLRLLGILDPEQNVNGETLTM